MKNLFSRLFTSSKSGQTGQIKLTLFQRLVEPVNKITNASERRKARMVSAVLLAVTLSMSGAWVYFGFFSSSPDMMYLFIVADIVMGILYFLSRTKYNHISGVLSVFTLSLIPFLHIVVSREFNLESILIYLIANTLTILISSAIISISATALFASFNVLTIILIPLLFPTVGFLNSILTMLSNIAISLAILIFAHHRNLIEKDRLLEMSQLNASLQNELKQRKQTEARLAYTSVHDPLTDLPNRVLFMDRLSHVMERARRHKNFNYAVFFLDLDRFKIVNDSLGHTIGDKLLVESSKRLNACIREEDTIARLGGDEFVILLEEVNSTEAAIQVAERIQNSLTEPFDLAGHMIFVFVSMGIVLGEAGYEQPDHVLRDADIAMYRAKGQGPGHYKFFDPTMLNRAMTRLELETDLRKALDERQFIVHYQPILDMASQRVIGFEALVRWQHPTNGLIPPVEFIPTAEETGLIIPLGYWVLSEACRQIHAWNTQYGFDPPLTVNVNLSTRQCEQPDLAQNVSDILNKYKLDPGLLNLELTESLLIKDTDLVTRLLKEFRKLGIRVQIDDFGTGYSSLSYLHTLPIDTLKIDRSFIGRLGVRDNDGEIVKTILSLAHNLGMKVVAEGVETDRQFSALKAMNCEYMQGFLFSKAVNNHEAEALLGKLKSEEKN